MGHEAAINHVAEWLGCNVLVHTGRTQYAKFMAKPLQVWELSVQATPEFWKANYGYINDKGKGQKSVVYRIFRDEVLLPALHKYHATQIDAPAAPRYLYKSAQLNSGDPAVRAILEWEMVSGLMARALVDLGL